MNAEFVEFYNQKYGKEKVDKALELLSYKTTSIMPKNEKPGALTMYIFRHGQTKDNEEFIFSGWRDSPLTDKGRQQALDLAHKLQDKKLDMLISSPQIRAVETMQISISLNLPASKLDITKDPRIKERSYGILQGKSKLEIQLENPELLKEIRRSYKYQPEDGESIEMVCIRVADFCQEIIPIAKKYRTNLAISCHGNSIRGFRKYFENLSEEETAELETPLGQDYCAYSLE